MHLFVRHSKDCVRTCRLTGGIVSSSRSSRPSAIAMFSSPFTCNSVPSNCDLIRAIKSELAGVRSVSIDRNTRSRQAYFGTRYFESYSTLEAWMWVDLARLPLTASEYEKAGQRVCGARPELCAPGVVILPTTPPSPKLIFSWCS